MRIEIGRVLHHAVAISDLSHRAETIHAEIAHRASSVLAETRQVIGRWITAAAAGHFGQQLRNAAGRVEEILRRCATKCLRDAIPEAIVAVIDRASRTNRAGQVVINLLFTNEQNIIAYFINWCRRFTWNDYQTVHVF